MESRKGMIIASPDIHGPLAPEGVETEVLNQTWKAAPQVALQAM